MNIDKHIDRLKFMIEITDKRYRKVINKEGQYADIPFKERCKIAGNMQQEIFRLVTRIDEIKASNNIDTNV